PAANQVGDSEGDVPQADDLQMGDLTAGPFQRSSEPADDPQEKRVQIKRLRGLDVDAAVQPAHLRLAFRVRVVVDVEYLAAKTPLLVEQFGQWLKSLPGPGGDS